MNAHIPHKKREKTTPPKKVLAIRFQALGDLVITLPYLQDIKRQYPETQLHLFTRREVSQIPQALDLFDKIIIIDGGRNAKIQFLLSLLKLPALFLNRYDMVLDLQNHKISTIMRKLLRTPSWVEFDRSSPLSAGERTRQSIEKAWQWHIDLNTSFRIRGDYSFNILRANGWKDGHQLIVLNPAGFCESRHWPIENYVAFAKLWKQHVNSRSQFVMLLLPSHQAKAKYIAEALGEACIDLTGKANQVEAFSILQKSTFVLSEDSGLMHMAWVQGIPTIALFSSSRKDWSAPQGEWSYCFDSSDMHCGPCMLEVCQYKDNRCITRYTPERIVAQASKMVSQTKISR